MNICYISHYSGTLYGLQRLKDSDYDSGLLEYTVHGVARANTTLLALMDVVSSTTAGQALRRRVY